MIHVFLLTLSAITSTVPEEFQGSYADALGSCAAGSLVHIRESSVEWGGKTDRVIFAEQVSSYSSHLFLKSSDASRGSIELHFEIQSDSSHHLIVIDHLSDAEDIATRGTPTPDKSVIGFYQRCGAGPDR